MPPNGFNYARNHRSSNSSGKTKLPGLLPFIKYKSFPAPDSLAWKDGSFLSWFKAHGPAPKIVYSSCFKDFANLLSPHFLGTSSLVPSHSSSSPPLLSTVNPEEETLQSPSLVVPLEPMANISIDPWPYVPRGFQIQHIEGHTAVHRVVVPRHQRQHEDTTIVIINPMPPGQIPFDNIRDMLQDFLMNEARVVVRDIQAVLLVRFMCRLLMLEIMMGLLMLVLFRLMMCMSPLPSITKVVIGGVFILLVNAS
jgi:hypothetical protein